MTVEIGRTLKYARAIEYPKMADEVNPRGMERVFRLAHSGSHVRNASANASEWKFFHMLVAQLVEQRAAMREVAGSSPGRINTRDPKITEEKVLPL